MRILPINNCQSFQGLYKVPRNYVGNHTEQFIKDNSNNKDKNSNVIYVNRRYSDDIYIYVPKDKEKVFEQCVKNDKGKFWKAESIQNLMPYIDFIEDVFRYSSRYNNDKEKWTDYTDDLNQHEDEMPF